MPARRQDRRGELAKRRLRGRFDDQVRLGDQPIERERPVTAGGRGIAHRHARQRDAGDARHDGLGDVSADDAHADDADLDHGAHASRAEDSNGPGGRQVAC